MEAFGLMARLKYLLDTHALLWAATDEDRLSNTAARAIATTSYEQLAISDVIPFTDRIWTVGPALVAVPRLPTSGSPTRVQKRAVNGITLQEIGLLLHAGRIVFQGSPTAVLGKVPNYTNVPLVLDFCRR